MARRKKRQNSGQLDGVIGGGGQQSARGGGGRQNSGQLDSAIGQGPSADYVQFEKDRAARKANLAQEVARQRASQNQQNEQARQQLKKNALQKVGSFLGGAAKTVAHDVVEPFKDVGHQVKQQFKALSGPNRTEQGLGGADAIIKNQTAAAKNPEYKKATQGSKGGGTVAGTLDIQRKAAAGAKAPELKQLVQQDQHAADQNVKHAAGTALELAGLAIPGGKAVTSTAERVASKLAPKLIARATVKTATRSKGGAALRAVASAANQTPAGATFGAGQAMRHDKNVVQGAAEGAAAAATLGAAGSVAKTGLRRLFKPDITPEKTAVFNEATGRMKPLGQPKAAAAEPKSAVPSEKPASGVPAKEIQTTYYRGGGEGSMPKGKTAKDVVAYEHTQLGNADVKATPGVDLSKVKSDNLQWVTGTKGAAKEYGDVSPVQVGDHRVVATDTNGGMLIEKIPPAESKAVVAAGDNTGAPVVAADEAKATSKIASTINQTAIKNKLSTGYDELAGYSPTTHEAEVNKVVDLIAKDPERARRAATGAEGLPQGISGSKLLLGMAEHAVQTKDHQLLADLAKSPLASGTSAHAQELALLGEKDPHSAISKVREVAAAKRAAAEKRLKQPIAQAGRQTVQELKASVKAPSRMEWGQFVESIKCK
jgi:hypothetical protein